MWLRFILFFFCCLIYSQNQKDKLIYAIISNISEDRLKDDIQTLVNFGTRHTLSDTISESDAASLKEKDQSCQASDVEEMIKFLNDSPGNIKVLIDCTASDVIPDLYARCFEAKICARKDSWKFHIFNIRKRNPNQGTIC